MTTFRAHPIDDCALQTTKTLQIEHLSAQGWAFLYLGRFCCEGGAAEGDKEGQAPPSSASAVENLERLASSTPLALERDGG